MGQNIGSYLVLDLTEPPVYESSLEQHGQDLERRQQRSTGQALGIVQLGEG